MLLNVKDGQGQDQVVIAAGQEEPSDVSGLITGGNQTLLPANSQRAGWFFQNAGNNPMQINELGADASAPIAAGAGSFIVPPGGIWPPPGFALTISEITIFGTVGDPFVAREWSTPAP